MAYIEVNTGLRDHAKTVRAARLLKTQRSSAIGCVIVLWHWALESAPEGNLSPFSPQEIADVVGWEGNPQDLIHALVHCGIGNDPGFLEYDDGRLMIHGWFARDGLLRINWDNRLPRGEWDVLREMVFRRDNYTCRYCGSTAGPFHCDHVIPVSRGGSNEMKNLATACAACNLSKHDKTPEEWRNR